jgi:hypothetical protein
MATSYLCNQNMNAMSFNKIMVESKLYKDDTIL